jgi:hypothetical protein
MVENLKEAALPFYKTHESLHCKISSHISTVNWLTLFHLHGQNNDLQSLELQQGGHVIRITLKEYFIGNFFVLVVCNAKIFSGHNWH